MKIVETEQTPEVLACRIGNITGGFRSFSSTMLLFSFTASELVSAINFRPEIAAELESESAESEAMALVWSKAKAGLDAQAAEKAFDEILSNQYRISFASDLKKRCFKSTTCKSLLDRQLKLAQKHERACQ